MSFSIMIIAAAGLALANAAGTLGERDRDIATRSQLPGGSGRLDDLLAAVALGTRRRHVQAGAGSRNAPHARALARPCGAERRPAGAGADQFRPCSPDAAPAASPPGCGDRSGCARSALTATAVGPLLRSLRLLQWLAFGLVVLLGGAASAAVVLAARGALDTHRFTIEVMHGIGATDVQVTRLFQRKIALDALVGSLAGGIAAALVLLMLSAGAALRGRIDGRRVALAGSIC